jgi:hypothetical protein
MQSQETHQAELNQTIERCTQAYRAAVAVPPSCGHPTTVEEHRQRGFVAFCSHLPILYEPASFQIFLACVARGAAIGAMDPSEAGRLCHIAQTALSAWKLFNLVIPAAEEKQRLAREKGEEKSAPPSPNGNLFDTRPNPELEEQALQNALNRLPEFKVQKLHFQYLRRKGQLLPCDAELRENSLAALHFVKLSEQMQREQAQKDYPAETYFEKNSAAKAPPASDNQPQQAQAQPAEAQEQSAEAAAQRAAAA